MGLGVYSCTQVKDLEWDPKKARLNARKHGVAFADAVAVLEDPDALTISEESADGESRFVTVGMDAFGRVLVVVSARNAKPGERRQYAEGL